MIILVHIKSSKTGVLRELFQLYDLGRLYGAGGSNPRHASASKIYAAREIRMRRMRSWLAPLLLATNLLGQPPTVQMPAESAGLDGITRP